jgi:hypothetical protein
MMRCFLGTFTVLLVLASGVCANEAFVVRVHAIDKANGFLVFLGLIAVPNMKGDALDFIEGPIKESLKNFKVYDRVGNQFAREEVLDKLKPGMILVIAKKGDKIDQSKYLFLTKDTLILIESSPREPQLFSPVESTFVILGRAIREGANSLLQIITKQLVG